MQEVLAEIILSKMELVLGEAACDTDEKEGSTRNILRLDSAASIPFIGILCPDKHFQTVVHSFHSNLCW